jgi:folylpolyglutamate synthase/dihydropteroate synthase
VASERTASANDLATTFRAANPRIETMVAAKLQDALNACKHERFVLITGSLYLVGEALEQLGHLPADVDERGLNEWAAPKLSR